MGGQRCRLSCVWSVGQRRGSVGPTTRVRVWFAGSGGLGPRLMGGGRVGRPWGGAYAPLWASSGRRLARCETPHPRSGAVWAPRGGSGHFLALQISKGAELEARMRSRRRSRTGLGSGVHRTVYVGFSGNGVWCAGTRGAAPAAAPRTPGAAPAAGPSTPGADPAAGRGTPGAGSAPGPSTPGTRGAACRSPALTPAPAELAAPDATRGTRGAAARLSRRARCDGDSHLERISSVSLLKPRYVVGF